MANIEIKNLTFGYQETLLFNHASFNIDESWRLGLVGRNGRGKTTLLQLLTRKLETDLAIISNRTFVYFPQLTEIPQERTDQVLASAFALQMPVAAFTLWELERELTLLKVDLDVLERPFDSLSGGEQTKCLLALLFLDKTNFPLLDEPTNHLDWPSRAIVADYLRHKSGFIVVSHDRAFLDTVCDHTLVIEREKIALYQGNFSTYEAEKARQDAFELEKDEKLRRDISHLKKTAHERRDWAEQRETVHGATFVDKKVAKKQNARAKSIEKRMATVISDKEKLLKNIEKVDALTINLQSDHHKIALQFEQFQLNYGEASLALPQGEIIALTGMNGTGKSSMMKYLTGDFTGSHTGTGTMAYGLKLSVVRQIFDNRGPLKAFASAQKLDFKVFLSNLRKLGMERRTFSQPIETMSRGQQKKVELAASLAKPAQLYLWDEPSNDLDIFNQEQLIQLLKEVKPTMLLIEHDQQFIEAVTHQQVKLEQ